MTQVVTAIIPQTIVQLEEEVKRVAWFSHVIQIDISDGIFTPTKTWPYNGRDVDFFDKLRKEEIGWPKWDNVNFEIHLMVKSPENVVLDWIHTGASSIIAQIEATEDFQKVIDICKENSVSVGVAIKPSTDINRLEPFANQVDFIQVMGSDDLGRHGVKLENIAIDKIQALRKLYPERIIGIDIGVTHETKGKLILAGANKLISGGAILKSAHPKDVFDYLSL